MIKGINVDRDTADSIVVAVLKDTIKDLYKEYKDVLEQLSKDPLNDLLIEHVNEAGLLYNSHMYTLSYYMTEHDFVEFMSSVTKID